MLDMSSKSLLPCFLGALFALATPLRAQAQGEEQTPAEAPAEAMTPPKLLEYVEADYPKEAFAQGLEAAVKARISVDENGLVTAVDILEPAGNGFDEAARDAIFQFTFEPARQGETPIASQVEYRYAFFIKEQAPVPGQAEPPKAALEGTVTDMLGALIPGASVVLVSLGGKEALADGGVEEIPPAAADDKGAFAFPEIPPGNYQVDVVAAGFKPLSVTEDLEDGEARTVIYRLEREAALYETVVRGRRPPREVTRREITRREITRIPGTAGDALRSVQNMPGVARSSFMGGELIVRGSSGSDSTVYLDETPVPLLYHFGGLTSVINSDLIERIDFYPGNYSVKYGGATGGIIDVTPRMPATDRLHASLDVSFLHAAALAEAPLGESWSVAASVRRSYIYELMIAAIPDDGGFAFTAAPRYWDYQVIADYHPGGGKEIEKSPACAEWEKAQADATGSRDQAMLKGEAYIAPPEECRDEMGKDNLRMFVYGSDDRLGMMFGDDVADNPNMGGSASISLGFHQFQLRYDHKFSKALSNHVNVGTGIWLSEGSLSGLYELEQTQVPIFLRDEIAIDTGRFFDLRAGLDAEVGWTEWSVVAPAQLAGEGEEFDPITANDEQISTSGSTWYARPALYAEAEMKAIEDLRLIYGLRADYYGVVGKVGVDPRFVARYEVVDGTTLKGGIGLFHQPPSGVEADDDYGNPDLDLTSAIHYSLGFEQKLPWELELSVEGFFKQLDRLVVSSDDTVIRDGEEVAERYNNDGRGKVYGLELMLKRNPTERLMGWISYTLMKSSRVDHPGEASRLFDYDQTHILTAVVSLVLGRGWEAGVRFRLVSGNPDTPVTGSIYDADSDIYWPIYGATNSIRLPLFHQLDLRIDKKWAFKYLKLAVYIDVQNVYNHKNVEGYSYSYDYSQKVYLNGLPVLPILGLKLEY